MDRRNFLKGAAAATAVLVPAGFVAANPETIPLPPPVEELDGYFEDDGHDYDPEPAGPPIEQEVWTPGNFDVALFGEDGQELAFPSYRRVRGDAQPPAGGRMPIRAIYPTACESWGYVCEYALYVREPVDMTMLGLPLIYKAGDRAHRGKFDDWYSNPGDRRILITAGNTLQLKVDLGFSID